MRHLAAFQLLLADNGELVMPAQPDILRNLALHEQDWIEFYTICFVPESEHGFNPLRDATRELDTDDLFGKSNENSLYCRIGIKDLRQMQTVAPAAELVRLLGNMTQEQLSQLRYVSLMKKPLDLGQQE